MAVAAGIQAGVRSRIDLPRGAPRRRTGRRPAAGAARQLALWTCAHLAAISQLRRRDRRRRPSGGRAARTGGRIGGGAPLPPRPTAPLEATVRRPAVQAAQGGDALDVAAADGAVGEPRSEGP